MQPPLVAPALLPVLAHFDWDLEAISMAAAAEKPENERKDDAEHDRGCQWKIEDRVFAAINKVARQTAERQVEAACDQQQDTDGYDDAAQNEQKLAQFGHKNILAGRTARLANRQKDAANSANEHELTSNIFDIRGIRVHSRLIDL
jgi:hypothetical protein